jgi:hypothetical protein
MGVGSGVPVLAVSGVLVNSGTRGIVLVGTSEATVAVSAKGD